jgi:hypothetical protein
MVKYNKQFFLSCLASSLFAIGIFIGLPKNIKACDVCGAGSFQNQSGLLNSFNGNLIGLRHTFRSFNSVHPSIVSWEPDIESNEAFHSTELFFRYMPTQKLQLFLTLPYNNYLKTEQGVKEQNSSIGDISFLANYKWIEKKGTKTSHLLFTGAGIKAPTGNYNIFSEQHQLIIPNMQPGTGSWDFSISTQYIVKFNTIGFNFEGAYLINGYNSLDYDFGNRSSVAAGAFKSFQKENHSFFVQAGLRYDYAEQDYLFKSEKIINDFSGGNFLDGSIIAEWYFKNWAVTTTILLPISNNYAMGYVEPSFRGSLAVIYFLKNKEKPIFKSKEPLDL